MAMKMNKSLLSALSRGDRRLHSLSSSVESIPQPASCSPFIEVETTFLRLASSDASRVVSVSSLINRLERLLTDNSNTDVKKCFNSWVQLEESKNENGFSSYAQSRSATRKRKSVQSTFRIPKKHKEGEPLAEIAAGEKAAKERFELFAYLKQAASFCDSSSTTTLPPEVAKIIGNSGSKTASVVTNHVMKRPFHEVLEKNIPCSPKKRATGSQLLSPVARHLVKRSLAPKHPIPLKKPMMKRQHTSSRDKIKMKSVRKAYVDEMVEKSMVAKRQFLRNHSQQILRQVTAAAHITEARKNGRIHPMCVFDPYRRRDLAFLVSKNTVIIEGEETDVLKNLTAKVTKSARQHGAVTFDDPIDQTPRFSFTKRVPFKTFTMKYAGDRGVITSDNDGAIDEEAFLRLVDSKISNFFYDEQVELKVYSGIDDFVMLVNNLEALYMFQRDSPYGDFANSRRDMLSRTVLEPQQLRISVKKPLAEYICKVIGAERGREPKRWLQYEKRVERYIVPESSVSPSISEVSTEGQMIADGFDAYPVIYEVGPVPSYGNGPSYGNTPAYGSASYFHMPQW